VAREDFGAPSWGEGDFSGIPFGGKAYTEYWMRGREKGNFLGALLKKLNERVTAGWRELGKNAGRKATWGRKG